MTTEEKIQEMKETVIGNYYLSRSYDLFIREVEEVFNSVTRENYLEGSFAGVQKFSRKNSLDFYEATRKLESLEEFKNFPEVADAISGEMARVYKLYSFPPQEKGFFDKFAPVKDTSIGEKLAENDFDIWVGKVLKGYPLGSFLSQNGRDFSPQELAKYQFSTEELEEFFWEVARIGILPPLPSTIDGFTKLWFARESLIKDVAEHIQEALTMTEDEFWEYNWDWPEQMCNDAKLYEKRVREFHRFVSENFPKSENL